MSFRRSQSGFSLVELLVVASIIILLSSMAVASYRSTKYRTFNEQAEINFMKLKTAIESYVNNVGEFPLSRCNGHSPICLKHSEQGVTNGSICLGSDIWYLNGIPHGTTGGGFNSVCRYNSAFATCSALNPPGYFDIDEQLRSYLGHSLVDVSIDAAVTESDASGWGGFMYISHAAEATVKGFKPDAKAGAYLAWFKAGCQTFTEDECLDIRLSGQCNGHDVPNNGCAYYLGRSGVDYNNPAWTCNLTSDKLPFF